MWKITLLPLRQDTTCHASRYMTTIEVIKAAHLSAHTSAVYALCNGIKENDFFSAGGDGLLIRWNPQQPDKAYLTARVPEHIFSLCLLSDKTILLGRMSGNIHVVDLNKKQEIKNIAFYAHAVFDIQPAEKGTVFFVAGGDGTLSVWASEDFTLLKQQRIAEKSIRALVINEKEGYIYAGSSDCHIYVIDYKTLHVHYRWQAHRNSVFSLCLSPCGRYLLSGSRDAHFSVWTVRENFRLLLSQPAHLFTINHIVYSPDQKFVATAGRDKHIKIWDAENFTLRKVISKEKQQGHINSVNRLLWRDDYLISCSDDRSVMLWKIITV